VLGTVALAALVAGVPAHSATTPRETIRPIDREQLPNVPGKDLIAIEVLFPPGAASVPHFHPKTAFVYAYVISGVIVSAVNHEKPRAYRAGEGWHEAPGAFHRLTRNGSRTQPARLLAIFIADNGESHLVRRVKE
jgi:quercetin dioxygenase-like cupin family protein